MASRSQVHVFGRNDEELPHYYVELTENQLSEFEVFDSLCSNECYESVLYISEQKLNRSIIPVLPGEVIDVLLTLAIGDNDGTSSLRKRGPLNVGTSLLRMRSLQLLTSLLDILVEFDCEKYDCHSLELLRCQFFYFVDRIQVNKGRSLVESQGSVKKDLFNRCKGNNTGDSLSYLSAEEFTPKLYSSYVSLIDVDQAVSENSLISRILSRPGFFWNLISWSLKYSIDFKGPNYHTARQWLSVIELLFRIYHIRLDYLLHVEIGSSKDNGSKDRNIMKNSKIFEVFEGVDHKNLCQGLIEYIFVGCVKHETLHPIAPLTSAFDVSWTYINQYTNTTSHLLQVTMELRRSILNLFFKVDTFLLQDDRQYKGKSYKSFSRIVTDYIFYEFSIDTFRHIFMSFSLSIDFKVLSHLAESFVQKCFDSFQIKYTVKVLDNMSNHVNLANEIFQIIDFLRKSNVINKTRFVERKMQLEFCVLLFSRFGIYMHGSKKFKTIPNFEQKIKLISMDNKVNLKDLQHIFNLY